MIFLLHFWYRLSDTSIFYFFILSQQLTVLCLKLHELRFIHKPPAFAWLILEYGRISVRYEENSDEKRINGKTVCPLKSRTYNTLKGCKRQITFQFVELFNIIRYWRNRDNFISHYYVEMLRKQQSLENIFRYDLYTERNSANASKIEIPLVILKYFQEDIQLISQQFYYFVLMLLARSTISSS